MARFVCIISYFLILIYTVSLKYIALRANKKLGRENDRLVMRIVMVFKDFRGSKVGYSNFKAEFFSCCDNVNRTSYSNTGRIDSYRAEIHGVYSFICLSLALQRERACSRSIFGQQIIAKVVDINALSLIYPSI